MPDVAYRVRVCVSSESAPNLMVSDLPSALAEHSAALGLPVIMDHDGSTLGKDDVATSSA